MASNIQPIQLANTVGTWADGYTFAFPEGGSQSFLLGMPLTITSGLAVILASTTTAAIAGISCAKATGTTGSATNKNCQMQLVLPSTIWLVSVDTTFTTANPAPGTGKPSDFTIGTSYSLCVDSTSGLACMTTGTGNPVFQYLGADPTQNSVINGRAYVRILTSQTFWT